MFELHQTTKEDTFLIGSFPLSLLLLNNDSNYPWFILVPQRENIKEIFELNEKDQVSIIKGIILFSGYSSKKLPSK